MFPVTLVSSPPEIQWVALRNINLILQKNPDVLSNEMRVFFCKYNDPAYVKLEKLDIMVKISSEKNVDTLLSELKEYASEVDYDFVKKAIRAIGLVAIKIDNAAEKCVNVLLELISTKVSYVVQEAIIVIKVSLAFLTRISLCLCELLRCQSSKIQHMLISVTLHTFSFHLIY